MNPSASPARSLQAGISVALPTVSIDSSANEHGNKSRNLKKPAIEIDATEKELPAPIIHGETIEYRLSYKHFIPMRWTYTFNPDVKRYTQRNIREWLAEEPAPMSDEEWAAIKARLLANSRGRSKGKGGGASPGRGGRGAKSVASVRSTKTAKTGKSAKSASPAGKKGVKASTSTGKAGKGAKGGKGKGKVPEPEPEPEPEPPKLPSVLVLNQSIFPQPKNVLKKGLIRSYSDGRPWMAFFEDGSGSVFHPEGGVAINIIPWLRLNKEGDQIAKPRVWNKERKSFTQDEYAESFLFSAHSHKTGGELVGLFLPTGRTSWLHQTPKDKCHFESTKTRRSDPNHPGRCRPGRLRLVTDKLMGVQLNVKGDIENTWRWFDEVYHVTEKGEEEKEGDDEDFEAELGGATKGEEDEDTASKKSETTTMTKEKATIPKTTTTAPKTTTTTTTKTTTTTPVGKKTPGGSGLLAEMINAVDSQDELENLEDPVNEKGGGGLTRSLVKAPPIGVVAGKIDRNIGVKIVSQEKMSLSFQAENRLVSFNVGSKIALLSEESVLDSTCKNYKQEIRDFRRKTRTLMRQMKDVIPQVELELKLAKKI